MRNKTSLPYVICFCKKKDSVLLIKRLKAPWTDRWNGLGGKIDSGESPRQALRRELIEETNLDIRHAKSIRYAGVITWTKNRENIDTMKGMYVFVVDLTDRKVNWKRKKTNEGKRQGKNCVAEFY